MEITLDTLMVRRSVRSYTGQDLSPDQRTLLEQILADEAGHTPFGNRPRFRLTDPGVINPGLPRQAGAGCDPAARTIGTYGLIKNPPAFIVGAVAAGKDAVLDYGFAMEGIILAATAAGLGTCWLGGTFDRTSVTDILALQHDEIIPAITPVGLPAEKRSLTERTMRFLARSDSRKPWGTLFFDGLPGTSLDKDTAGQWAPVLEAVRMGPSASNKQPWRILREGPSRFSLLFAEDKAYNSALGIPIQELDLGIAMKHFELAAAACALPGRWSREPPAPMILDGIRNRSMIFIASWAA